MARRAGQAFVRRTTLRRVFLLRNDAFSPAVVDFGPEEALRSGRGEIPGMSRGPTAKVHPFFNPHLLSSSSERLELHRGFIRRLLQAAECYMFNSGVGSAGDIVKLVQGK